MPRGGRRPGAGAPKGNYNRLNRGNDSLRLRFTYLAFLACPEKHQLGLDIQRAGYYDARFHFDRRNLGPFLTFLHHYFFVDKEEAIALHRLKPAKRPPATPLIEPPLPAVFNQTTPPPRTYRPPPPASPPRKTKTSNTIKQATATGASPPTTSDLERSEIQRLPLKPSETPNDYARRTT